jgi:3-methyladenine DNA glycosylase AlkD
LPDPGAELAGTVSERLSELADQDYARGAAASRRPGKPTLGVAIPLLRSAVLAQVRPCRGRPDLVLAAADVLWHGSYHEEELAACMALRLTGGRLQAPQAVGWAELLDNWLSTDELSGCLSESLTDDLRVLPRLRSLADSISPWQRRLYVAALIKPVCHGLDPGDIPGLPLLLKDRRQPVQKAFRWMIRRAAKQRPTSLREFGRVFDAETPGPLIRLVERETRLRRPAADDDLVTN